MPFAGVLGAVLCAAVGEASKQTRYAVLSIAVIGAVVAGYLGMARYLTFHNITFDLAFYSRLSWGLSQGDFWEPILSAHVFGLHLSPILVPLGALGHLLGTAEVLIATQAIVLGATAWPIASIAHRRFGDAGAVVAGLLWFLYPNLMHVASYEFHPGTLAVLPLTILLDGIDRQSVKAIIVGTVGVLLCREDMAAMTLIAGLLCLRTPKLRKPGIWIASLSALYLLVFLLYLHAVYAPERGSVDLHFGKWGGSISDVALAFFIQPGEVLSHLVEPRRLSYLPRLLAPLALLPLWRPKWLLIGLPVVGINLMSEWPTTIDLDSHYQTALMPVLFMAGLDGAERLKGKLADKYVLGGLILSSAAMHILVGGTPLSVAFKGEQFVYDDRSAAAERIVAMIPPDASVQAPYPLMPHLAERQNFGPAPPPDRNHEYVVLDAWHRSTYAHNEDLIRTEEEPVVRGWLARGDYGVIAVDEPYFLLKRGADSRDGPGMRHRIGSADPEFGERLAACLRLRGATIEQDSLVLDLGASGPCPADLAVRIGVGERPRRVDLLCAGELSPATFQQGDRLRSVHPILPGERSQWAADGLRVGLLRSSGARPEHADPKSIPITPTP